MTVQNRHGKDKVKPLEISQYNKNMSGIDRNDQMISYYSSPRKSIRWYKKVMFHLLDVTLWNAYYIRRKFDAKQTFLQFREDIIKSYLEIPNTETDGRNLVQSGPVRGGKRKRSHQQEMQDEQPQRMHFPALIPNAKDPQKSHHMRCRHCATQKKRKETKFLCKTCPDKPPLCVVPCFEDYHKSN